MNDMTRWERFVTGLLQLLTGVRHGHRPARYVECARCQHNGWLEIAAQYPVDSPEWRHYRARAEAVDE